MSSPEADADFSKRQVQVIMQDDQVFWLDFEEPEKPVNGFPGKIHIGQGFGQDYLFIANLSPAV
jgi:hypothetical protein